MHANMKYYIKERTHHGGEGTPPALPSGKGVLESPCLVSDQTHDVTRKESQ